jgi:flavin-dependent dehydrogenase
VRPDGAFDAVVLGAGPAGACAALRLLAFGYRVALVERLLFPRPQVGESLSPGVWDVLSLLDADTEVRRSALVEHLPARVAWDDREPRLIPAEARDAGAMVDRGAFDARLASLAERRGAALFQPARVRRTEGAPGDWILRVAGSGGDLAIRTRLIVDARGRRARPPAPGSASGPPTLAAWIHTDAARFPRETRVEAIDRAWLWGAPAADGRYRVMAFFDPSLRSQGAGFEGLLRSLLADAPLFAPAARSCCVSPVFVRAATPYLDPKPWRPGVVGVGERVLALDPLSSTGVEKSLRGALQAAIAIHTALRDPADTDLARAFYASRLAESAARHARWTRTYYRQAWPGPGHAFWRDRAAGPDDDGEGAEVSTNTHAVAALALVTDRLRLSPDARFVATPCVVDDRIQLREAVRHPRLDGPVAFLGDIEVVPLLRLAIATDPLPPGQWLALWSRVLPAATAMRLLHWLLRHDVLTPDAIGGSCAPGA